LPPIVEETIALFREGYPDVHFEFRKEGVIPTLKLDRQQIRQCMINLVDNAISSIHAQGNITISVLRPNIGKKVQIEVADNGAGISNADKLRLFEPDFSTKATGMGLGLAIVNSIVTDHHGTIRTEDNHPKGARFIIELPV
jgi:two-component system nitrogen regulation sensor histidine kinase NtrY